MTEITYDDFCKVELKIGQILSAESVPKSDKLLILQVDLGEEKPRQIVAGIAKFFNVSDLLQRKALFVTNLVPRKLMGIESHGMICAVKAGENDEFLQLIGPNTNMILSVKPGAKVG